MNSKEAEEVIKNGGIVASVGGPSYIFSREWYFAFGTYPDCLRGGAPKTLDAFPDHQWESLTEREIVCRYGYAKSNWYDPVLNDGTVDFEKLENYLSKVIEPSNRSDPAVSAKACRAFFETTGTKEDDVRLYESTLSYMLKEEYYPCIKCRLPVRIGRLHCPHCDTPDHDCVADSPTNEASGSGFTPKELRNMVYVDSDDAVAVPTRVAHRIASVRDKPTDVVFTVAPLENG